MKLLIYYSEVKETKKVVDLFIELCDKTKAGNLTMLGEKRRIEMTASKKELINAINITKKYV